MPKRLFFNDRTEWLEARKQGIGASEVGSVIGVNPWETKYQLWRYKMGLEAPKEENFAMKAGHYLEDAVSKFYADETGANIIASSAQDFMIVDDKRSFLRVSPDRTYWASGALQNAANKRILECKTTQMTIDPDNIPMHWFCQLQMNLGVSGATHGALAWLTMGREFGYKEISFDKEFYDYLCSEVEKFWYENIINKVEPEATTVEDVLTKFPKNIFGKTISATDELVDKCRQLKEIKEEISSLTAAKNDLEDSIKLAMEDAEAVIKDGKPLVTWKSAKDSNKFNEKRFAAENPELYVSYKEVVAGSRRFLVK